MVYDVVIAGASFAGLAVASSLRTKKILLIDRKSIGALPTSACAAPLNLLLRQKVEGAILQTTREVSFKTAYGELRYSTLVPFATFDYQTYCKEIFQRFQGDFLKTSIKSFNGNIVLTDRGEFEGKVFVDATGWRAKLASSLNPDFVPKNKLGFGLETEVLTKTSKLNFIFDPKIIKGGYAWIFPAGERTRLGLGTYRPSSDLKSELKKFVESQGYKVEKIHGGFMPYGLRSPVYRNVFLVGDAAGQIVPLTGEGIRQAVYFGEKCAQIIQSYLDGNLSLPLALLQYSRFVNQHKGGYILFNFLQNLWLHLPNSAIELVSRTLGRPWTNFKFQQIYFDWMKAG